MMMVVKFILSPDSLFSRFIFHVSRSFNKTRFDVILSFIEIFMTRKVRERMLVLMLCDKNDDNDNDGDYYDDDDTDDDNVTMTTTKMMMIATP